MLRFEEYAEKYETIRMRREDGILELTFHTGGDTLQWGSSRTRSSQRRSGTSGAIPITAS